MPEQVSIFTWNSITNKWENLLISQATLKPYHQYLRNVVDIIHGGKWLVTDVGIYGSDDDNPVGLPDILEACVDDSLLKKLNDYINKMPDVRFTGKRGYVIRSTLDSATCIHIINCG